MSTATAPAPQDSPEQQAERLASTYIDFIVENRPEQSLPLPKTVYLADVNRHIATLSFTLNTLKQKNYVPYPCIVLGGNIVPVDMIRYFSEGPDTDRSFGPAFFEDPVGYTEAFINRNAEQSNLVFPDQNYVIEATFFNLRSFLEERLTGLKSFFAGGRNKDRSPADPINHDVVIHTVTPGLLLESSPAFIASWSYFHHPTSPATGQLLGGQWIFRGKSLSQPQKTADTIVKIPQTLNISLHDL